MQPVLLKLPNEAAYIQESIDSVRESEVISFSEDLDTVREGALSTNSLLEGRTCSSSAIDLAIEQADIDKLGSKGHNVWSHDVRCIRSGE